MKSDSLLRLCNELYFFILWQIYFNRKEMNILAEMCVLGLQSIYWLTSVQLLLGSRGANRYVVSELNTDVTFFYGDSSWLVGIAAIWGLEFPALEFQYDKRLLHHETPTVFLGTYQHFIQHMPELFPRRQCPEREIPNIHLVPSLRMTETKLSSL